MAWAALYFLKLHGGATRGITLNDSAAVIKHTQCLKLFTRCYENFANAENAMYPEFQGFNKPTRNCSWPRRFFRHHLSPHVLLCFKIPFHIYPSLQSQSLVNVFLI